MEDVCKELVNRGAGVLAGHSGLAYIWQLCVSVTGIMLCLLFIRPLMKKLPRTGMYILWIFVIFRIACPVTVTGIYNILPKKVEQSVAKANQEFEPERIASRLVDVFSDEETAAGETGSLRGASHSGGSDSRDSYGGRKNGYRLSSGDSKVDTVQKGQTAEKLPSGSAGGSAVTESSAGGEDRAGGENRAWGVNKLSAGDLLFLVWLAGVAACWCYVILSLARNSLKLRSATRLRDNIYVHAVGGGSFVAGLFSPKIYVPEHMEEEDMEYVLCHERIHIRRRDYLIKPFAVLVFSLLWFQPLTWVCCRLMMRDMEVSCDEQVIRKLGEGARKKYSYLLLSIASGEKLNRVEMTAFGAEAVKERIHHVMKYKKPGVRMMACLMIAVLLGGCGIVSAPEKETVKEIPKKKERTVYVEQTIDDVTQISIDGEPWNIGIDNAKADQEGQLRYLVLLSDKKLKGSYKMMTYQDGEWAVETPQWKDKLTKLLKGKHVEMQEFYFGLDGYLYLALNEYSMDWDEYFEKNNKDGEIKMSDDYYMTGNILIRIDEKSGDLMEIPVPNEKEKDAYDAKSLKDSKAITWNQYGFLSDGNIMILNSGHIHGLYNSAGELVTEIEDIRTRIKSEMVSGDDFVAWCQENQESGNYEVVVAGEDGKQDIIPTDVKCVKSTTPIALGVRENTIILAAPGGIYEAEYQDDEFTCIADSEKDNLYYLSLDGYVPFGRVEVTADGTYYIHLINEETEKFQYCSYTKKEG